MPTSTQLAAEGDRRRCPRYNYELEVRFEQHGPDGELRIGHGTTEDLSRRGLRFRADERLEAGEELVLRIAWPGLLQNVCPLELLLRGVVTRVTDRGTIVSIGSYEFRTCGARSFWQEPELSSNWRVA